jgi:hypothetical protein
MQCGRCSGVHLVSPKPIEQVQIGGERLELNDARSKAGEGTGKTYQLEVAGLAGNYLCRKLEAAARCSRRMDRCLKLCITAK